MNKVDIGIDPGKNTGIALYNPETKNLLMVESSPIHTALLYVTKAKEQGVIRKIYFEDARKRSHGGIKGQAKQQGAGSIKRDCTIWEDFLKDNGIEYVAVPPQSNTTKLDSERFKRLTGWSDRTNEHGRDAAMLVWGR